MIGVILFSDVFLFYSRWIRPGGLPHAVKRGGSRFRKTPATSLAWCLVGFLERFSYINCDSTMTALNPKRSYSEGSFLPDPLASRTPLSAVTSPSTKVDFSAVR